MPDGGAHLVQAGRIPCLGDELGPRQLRIRLDIPQHRWVRHHVARLVVYPLFASYRAAHPELAIVRTERLYPFPTDDLEQVLARYPGVERVAWVQEEPRNMGARKFVLPKIRHLVPFRIPLGDISRPERSRPAEGYPAAHATEQARIVSEALTS